MTGKLHNIAIKMRSSELLTSEWKDLAGKLLGIDNATRWNSWYDPLLTTAVEKKNQLNEFCLKHHKDFGDDLLTGSDWEVIEMTTEFLQPFWQATLIQEYSWSSLDQALHNMDILLKHYENSKVPLLSSIACIQS
jgi:hypothetical protein